MGERAQAFSRDASTPVFAGPSSLALGVLPLVSLALTALAHLGILKRFRMRWSYDWQQDLAAHSTGSLQNVRVMQGNNRIGLCDTSRLGRLCGPELRNGTGFFSSAWLSGA